MDMRGKVIILTGARRIGQAVATELATHGARVVITYRGSEEEARKGAQAVNKAGGKALCVQADLSNDQGITETIQAAERKFGGVDGLVHLASLYKPEAFASVTRSDLEHAFNIHVFAPFLILQKLKPALEKRGGGAAVLFSAADALYYPYKGYSSYHISKSAVSALVRVMAVELAPLIRVNAIAPGPILPPPEMSEEEKKRVAESTPLERWGGEEAIAHSVRYLLENDFINGHTLVVDGGRSIV